MYFTTMYRFFALSRIGCILLHWAWHFHFSGYWRSKTPMINITSLFVLSYRFLVHFIKVRNNKTILNVSCNIYGNVDSYNMQAISECPWQVEWQDYKIEWLCYRPHNITYKTYRLCSQTVVEHTKRYSNFLGTLLIIV